LPWALFWLGVAVAIALLAALFLTGLIRRAVLAEGEEGARPGS